MKLLASILVLAGLTFFVWLESKHSEAKRIEQSQLSVESVDEEIVKSDMAQAALDLMASLDQGQKKEAMLPFDDDERSFWHFTPSPHRGLTWEKMNNTQRDAMTSLLKQGLSEKGLEKTREIMALEEVLRMIEGRDAEDRYRHPELYYFMLFGDPNDQAWGWRFEGHHVSLNYTSVSNQLSVTPAFMGANPAEVPSGPHKGKRVLSAEEDLARDLLAAFDGEQLQQVIIAEKAPEEIVTGMDRKAMMAKQEGLMFGDMNQNQQKLLKKLIQNYLDNMEPSLAKEQLSRIKADGWENISFAWAGETERGPGKAHYYRIHGPSILLEYDNIQNNANHIHAVWRDLRNDFGEDLLKQHHQNKH